MELGKALVLILIKNEIFISTIDLYRCVSSSILTPCTVGIMKAVSDQIVVYGQGGFKT